MAQRESSATHRRSEAPTRGARRTHLLIILALMAALVQVRGIWAAELVLALLLLIVPGLLLLRALRVPADAIGSMPAYVPCASLVVLIAVAAAVDGLGPAFGVAQPLRSGPLLAGFELTCLALLVAAPRDREDLVVKWPSFRSGKMAAPLLLPVIVAAGTLRLNNGHGAALALISVVLC